MYKLTALTFVIAMINPEFSPEDEILLAAASQATLRKLYGALRSFYALDESSLEQTSVSTFTTENTQKLVEVNVNVAPGSDDIRRDEYGRKLGTRLASIKIADINSSSTLATKQDKLAGDFEFYYTDDFSAEDGAYFELYEVRDGQVLLCSDETVALVRRCLPDAEEVARQGADKQLMVKPILLFGQNGLAGGGTGIFERIRKMQSQSNRPPEEAA